MKTVVASVTRRGQVTIPVELVRELDMPVPGKVRFTMMDNGTVQLEPVRSVVDEWRGRIPGIPTTSEFEDEIEDAKEEAYAHHWSRLSGE